MLTNYLLKLQPTAIPMSKAYGPGIIEVVTTFDELDGYSQFKQPIKTIDETGHIQFICGECETVMPEHNPTCLVHLQYKKRQELFSDVEYKHPEGQCKGCPSPVEGPHKFSCVYGGVRASQVVLSAISQPDGSLVIVSPNNKTDKTS